MTDTYINLANVTNPFMENEEQMMYLKKEGFLEICLLNLANSKIMSNKFIYIDLSSILIVIIYV